MIMLTLLLPLLVSSVSWAQMAPPLLPQLLQNALSMRCIDVAQPTAPKAPLFLNACNGADPAQQLYMHFLGGSFGANAVTITTGFAGQCLEFSSGMFRMDYCDGNPGQLFTIQTLPTGMFMISVPAVGVCLDMTGPTQCIPSAASQQWRLLPALNGPSFVPTLNPNGLIVGNRGPLFRAAATSVDPTAVLLTSSLFLSLIISFFLNFK